MPTWERASEAVVDGSGDHGGKELDARVLEPKWASSERRSRDDAAFARGDGFRDASLKYIMFSVWRGRWRAKRAYSRRARRFAPSRPAARRAALGAPSGPGAERRQRAGLAWISGAVENRPDRYVLDAEATGQGASKERVDLALGKVRSPARVEALMRGHGWGRFEGAAGRLWGNVGRGGPPRLRLARLACPGSPKERLPTSEVLRKCASIGV